MNHTTYTHLTDHERDQIAIMRAQGLSQNEIARRLGRNKGTLSRELARNRSPVYRVYLPHKAQARAECRNRTSHERSRLKHHWIRGYVARMLTLGWSPEQIAGRLKQLSSDATVSPEAIYQYVYDPEVRKQIDLVAYLPRRHRKRFPKGHRRTHQNSHIPSRIAITERPKAVERRKQPGHWEADTVVSRQSLAALSVVVERKSRMVKIGKLSQKSASEFRASLNRRLSRYPQPVRRTITYDNGSENVEHEKVNTVLGTKSFFCNPYHSWEKGTVENLVGLIRRFLPKKTDLATITVSQVRMIERRLNSRPRKCLNYHTPLEVFSSECCT